MTDQFRVASEAIDIDGLSLEELRDLYRQLPDVIRARESAERAARVERVLAAAKAEGMNRDEIRALRATLTARDKGKRSRKESISAMYRDPKTGATWSGKGRKPAWIKAHDEKHGSLDALRIE